MLITPEGRFIPVNMDRCQDLMGGLLEHVTPVPDDLPQPPGCATKISRSAAGAVKSP